MTELWLAAVLTATYLTMGLHVAAVVTFDESGIWPPWAIATARVATALVWLPMLLVGGIRFGDSE